MPVYLVLLFGLVVPPAAVVAVAARRPLWRYRRTVLWSLGFVVSAGGAWDWLSWRTGVWRYDSVPTLGIWLSGLPIEEFVGFYFFGTLLIVGTALLAMTRGGASRG